jgi:membrane peptidoglycan carboxypeptidase
VLRAMHTAGAIDAAELDAARTAPLRFLPSAVD